MKKLVTEYTFDASAKTIELSEYGSDFDIKGLLVIVNVTDNIMIYNFAADGSGHSSVTADVVTLEYDTTGMSDTDELLIYYDDPAYYQIVNTYTSIGNFYQRVYVNPTRLEDHPCKHVDIAAGGLNPSFVLVGGTDRIIGLEGVILYPYDVYSINIDNTNKIWVRSITDASYHISGNYFN